MTKRITGHYLVDFNQIEDYIKEAKGVVKFTQYCGVNPQRLQACRSQNTGLTWEEVVKIAGYCNLTAEKISMIREKKIIQRITTQRYEQFNPYTESEEVLDGLKANIAKRLEMHSRPFVNEIIDIVNQVAIESAYLGTLASKQNNTQFIERAKARRIGYKILEERK